MSTREGALVGVVKGIQVVEGKAPQPRRACSLELPGPHRGNRSILVFAAQTSTFTLTSLIAACIIVCTE